MAEPPLGTPPPPEGSSGYPPPPPPGYLPPPPAGAYQQQGYGYVAGVRPDLAGFWIRFGALLIDSILVGTVSQIITSMGFAASNELGLFLTLVTFIAGVVYYAVLEGGPTGQTLGKKICGILVVDETLLTPGIGTARGVGRYFARILSGIPFGLGYFWMLWDPRNQCWHDKLAHTCVVRVSR